MKQIQVKVSNGENFTAAGLMKRYADQTGAIYRNSLWGAAELIIDAVSYQYHHWNITAENGVETVALFLEESK